MERMELEELVQSLQKRAERLERKQRRFLAAMLVLVAVFLLAGDLSLTMLQAMNAAAWGCSMMAA